jgi:hypothetical protein
MAATMASSRVGGEDLSLGGGGACAELKKNETDKTALLTWSGVLGRRAGDAHGPLEACWCQGGWALSSIGGIILGSRGSRLGSRNNEEKRSSKKSYLPSTWLLSEVVPNMPVGIVPLA